MVEKNKPEGGKKNTGLRGGIEEALRSQREQDGVYDEDRAPEEARKAAADESAFTITIATNNQHYIDAGGAPPLQEKNCCGYVAFLFGDGADNVNTQAQGKTNLGLLMEGLTNLFEPNRVLGAFFRAVSVKYMNGELDLHDLLKNMKGFSGEGGFED